MEVQAVFFGTFAGVLLLNFHVLVNKSDLNKGGALLWSLLRRLVISPSTISSEEEIQQKQRVEEELHKMRLWVFTQKNSFAIHIDLFMILRMCWKIVHQFEEVTVFDACESAAPYMFFTFFHSLSMIEIKAMWRVYQLTVLSTHTLFAFLRPSEVGIDTGAKYQVVSLIALSSSMLDSRVSLPFCCLEGLVNVYKAWKYFAGDPARYTSLLLDEVAICGLTCILVVVIKRLAKLHIESRLESGDYSCRLTGFRSVLRGVSDGDILLDANKTLVEDTTSLERLLSTQKKLTGTNLLHLFPGIDERNAFLQFLSASEAQPADWRTPSAFRVTLQGSLGPVSMDLFHVRVVNSSDSKEESFFHLLAIKQDADQMAIPDARDEGLSLNDTERESDACPASSSLGSEKELALSYNNLKEITLLLTSHSSMWDIGEVHLKYERSNFLDCGMPTLKNFTRPSDWERVLRKIHESRRSTSNGDDKAYFTKPLCLRLPGSLSRYMRAKKVSLGRASEAAASVELFWMNFRDLDVSQAQPARKLGGIHEAAEG